MNAEHKIDYIQFSTDSTVYKWLSDVHNSVKSPNKFYKYGRRYECGTLIMTGNPNSGKDLVVMSGRACEFHRDRLKDMMNDEIGAGAKVSRIDLCVTCDSGEPMKMFDELLKNGKVESRRYDVSQSKKFTDVNDTVETIYVGDLSKRKKKGIFRVYDKGLEQGLGFSLSRFELECKQSIAHNNAKRWIDGVGIGSMIKSAISIENVDWWDEIMGESTALPKYEKEQDETTEYERRWAWLCQQVAPALGKALAEDEQNGIGQANFDLFNEIVAKNYNISMGLTGVNKK